MTFCIHIKTEFPKHPSIKFPSTLLLKDFTKIVGLLLAAVNSNGFKGCNMFTAYLHSIGVEALAPSKNCPDHFSDI